MSPDPSFRWPLALALGAALAAGCTTATRKPAPVTERAPAEARATRPAAVPTPEPPAASRPAAKPAEAARADTYTVKPGDTLYGIALDHGLDYRDLAAWNGLENVNVIRVGQQLRLAPPATTATAPLKPRGDGIESRPLEAAKETVKPTPAKPVPPAAGPTVAANPDKLKAGPRAARIPYSDQAWAQANRTDAPAVARTEPKPAATTTEVRPEAKPAAAPEAKGEAAVAAGDWNWPTGGKVIGQFNGNTVKGIDIAGKAGQPVLATAAGRVIFSGTGIRGLGKFVVIKHNNEFISVYGHNSELMVKQDQTVARGQKIAEMGNTDTDQVKLHFQIRRFGTPVDPLKFLPDRG